MSLDYSVAAMAVIHALKDGEQPPAPDRTVAAKATPGKKDMFRKYQGSTDPGVMLSRHHSKQTDAGFDIRDIDGGHVATVTQSGVGKVEVALV